MTFEEEFQELGLFNLVYGIERSSFAVSAARGPVHRDLRLLYGAPIC